MKSYLIITGSLFGLLAVAHVWRIIGEWPRLMHDPERLLRRPLALWRPACAFGLGVSSVLLDDLEPDTAGT